MSKLGRAFRQRPRLDPDPVGPIVEATDQPPHPGPSAEGWDLDREQNELRHTFDSCPCCEHSPCVWCGRQTMVEYGPLCGICEEQASADHPDGGPNSYDDIAAEPWRAMGLHPEWTHSYFGGQS